MEKKLATPPKDTLEKRTAHASVSAEDLEKKRELARKHAQEKVRARTMAK